MKFISIGALAAAFALSAAAAPPALAQTDPYGAPPPPQGGYQGGSPPQGGYQGGPPPGAQGGYQGGPGGEGYGPGPQGYGPQGYGGGPNIRNMTLQQFQARQVANLMRMDTDHDGRISLAEWTAWRDSHPGRGGGQVDPARSFARLDFNHDGYITPDEISAMAARRYARMEQGGAPGMDPGGPTPPPQPLGPH